LVRLRAQVADDRAALDRHLDTLAALDPATGDAGVHARVAIALHHAYAAVEAILERCMTTLEGSAPRGADSHRAILDAAHLNLPGVRGPLLSRSTVASLHELRGFRHFLHHAYGAEFDPPRLVRLREAALAIRPSLAADLTALDTMLASVAATPE
jgi:hypothetical protein